MGTCVQRGSGRPFAVEVVPRLDSAYAQTELPEVEAGADRLDLRAEVGLSLPGTAMPTDAGAGLFTADGHVMAFTPSAIPGRQDLELDTDMASWNFRLRVRNALVGQDAAIWILPAPMTVRQPPVYFAAVLGEKGVAVMFPGADQLVSLGGILLGPLGDPLIGYQARARSAATGDVISNLALTTDTGRFELKVAASNLPVGDASAIAIDLSPPGGSDADLPHFVSQARPLPAMMGSAATFHMPAFGTPGALVFAVRGTGPMQALPNVTVKLHTEIAAAPEGSAIYDKQAATNLNGEVQVSLIPGTADRARMYQVTAFPPPDSDYALKCIPQFPVTVVGSNAQSPYAATLVLDRKPTVKGVVSGSDGRPVPGLGLTATPIAGAAGCVDAQPLGPVSTTTGHSGEFSIRLDPGAYRLDIEPPAGSPHAALTLDGDLAWTITGDLSRDIVLPSGEVVEGDVRGADSEVGLASATVRFFEVLCAGDTCGGDHRVEPALRAQTRTDAMGHFRTVLPLPSR